MGDPVVGELYRKRGFEFRVDYVENGEVYAMRWPLSKRTDEMARGVRVTLEVWRNDMADAELVSDPPQAPQHMENSISSSRRF